MEKKDIDWGALGFAYQPPDYSYVSNYKDGKWDEGTPTTDRSDYPLRGALASSAAARGVRGPQGVHHREGRHRLLQARPERKRMTYSSARAS